MQHRSDLEADDLNALISEVYSGLSGMPAPILEREADAMSYFANFSIASNSSPELESAINWLIDYLRY